MSKIGTIEVVHFAKTDRLKSQKHKLKTHAMDRINRNFIGSSVMYITNKESCSLEFV